MKCLLLILLFTFWKFPYNPRIDADYFSAPVKIPLYLAGNFGELRANHFHSGIDIKTQGRTGIPVYAAADGWLSRVSISPFGFGLAIYIDHPNGYTTVYGHLDGLRDDLKEFARNIQYEKQSFAIDIPVPNGLFKFEKGELVAYSGNSGSSGGPHLHFEIRDTDSEHPLNPLLFNFKIADSSAPKIYSVLIYPLSNDAVVGGKTTPQRYETVFANGTYRLKDNPVVSVAGQVGFGIQTLDFLDGSTSKCGVYDLQLAVNDEPVYEFKMNELSFDESRYINSHIDYAHLQQYGRRYHKNWVEPGNHLNNYPVLENQGKIETEAGKTYHVNYLLKDVKGNSSQLNFQVLGQAAGQARAAKKGIAIEYNSGAEIEKANASIAFESGSFYSDFILNYAEKPATTGFYSPTIQLLPSEVPVHRFFKLRLKTNGLPENLEGKALIAAIDPKTGKRSSLGGSYKNGWVEAKARQLGSFAVTTDTNAPTITPLNIQNRTTLTNKNKISFKITDDLSGIDSYRGEIDGEWVLLEYDAKNALIEYHFDTKRLQLGKNHELTLIVKDAVGNEKTYEAKFYR
ncbi:MAG: M23 family metallopeptidase [Mangrovibacterium sp.]